KEPVDLHTIIDQSVEACRALMDERRHSFHLSLPEEPVRLEADPTRLIQVLCNLLNNAARYTDPGGEIWLSVQVEGSETSHPSALDAQPSTVRITVRDTGSGIEPETLPRVFDLFVQGERSLARTEGGLGIGLTLVRMLVEQHGGSVSAASEGVGK